LFNPPKNKPLDLLNAPNTHITSYALHFVDTKVKIAVYIQNFKLILPVKTDWLVGLMFSAISIEYGL